MGNRFAAFVQSLPAWLRAAQVSADTAGILLGLLYADHSLVRPTTTTMDLSLMLSH